MDRRSVMKHAGLAGILAAGAAGLAACGKKDEAAATGGGAAPAAGGDSVRWRLASSFPKALDTIFGAADVMAAEVKRMSGGKFEISIHPGGELMPPFGVVDGVKDATVEMAHTAPYYFFGKDETFALGCAIPFGLNSRQNTAWRIAGNGGKLMNEFYAQYNIVGFPGGNTGAQMGGWYRKEINSPADIKGLKFRVGGFAGKVIEKLGGVPQNIPGGEIYSALEKGTIDAAEWVGPYDDQKLGFHKVAKNYYYPGWWEGGPQLDFFVNKAAYDKLSEENKAILAAACHTAHVNMQAQYDAKNPVALRQLVSEGAKLLPFNDSVMNAAFAASMDLYSELSAKNANWKKVYDDYSAFRKEQNTWFRFTESRFDNFMQKQKL